MPVQQVDASHIIEQDIQIIVDAVGEPMRQLSGKRLLLTGASGYLAAYMADCVVWLNDYVLAQPCTLLALVRTPVRDDARLGHLLQRTDVQFLVQDVAERADLKDPVDFIIHAASYGSPRSYLANPINVIDANSLGTRWLLEMAHSHHSESFLYFSTGEIYGDATVIPTPETYEGKSDPLAPRAIYSESKRFGEMLAMAFFRQNTVPVKIVRPFHIYGPGQRLDDGRVMADFMRCRVAAEPIELLSDGTGVRAFCYIADAVTGFWKALLSGHNGEAFNIGDDREPISMRDLALQVAELDQPVLSTRFAESLPDHLRGTPSQVCPDISKARRLLAYAPAMSLTEGLRRTLAWYKNSAA